MYNLLITPYYMALLLAVDVIKNDRNFF